MSAARNAEFRAEYEAWAADPNADELRFMNIRVLAGDRFGTLADVKAWARANGIVTARDVAGNLMARRAEVLQAFKSPAIERVYYTIKSKKGDQYDTRIAAAEALRVAMGWKTIWLSHDIDVKEVTAFEREPRINPFAGIDALPDVDPTAPRIYRHVEFVHTGVTP